MCIQLHAQFCESNHFSWQKDATRKIKMQFSVSLLCVCVCVCPKTDSAGKF